MAATRSTRTVHRWVGPPFVAAAIASLIYTSAGGDEEHPVFLLLGIVLVASLLALVVTGSVLWVQHYRRGRRRRPGRATT